MTCRPQTLNLLPQHCTLKTEYDSKTSPCSSHYEQVKGAWSSSIATTARENNGNDGQIHIAKWVRNALDLNDGDELLFEVVDNKIIFTKAEG